MLRAFDQTQDVADRVFWKISNRLDEYEEKIEKILQEHELNSKPHKGKWTQKLNLWRLLFNDEYKYNLGFMRFDNDNLNYNNL